MLGGVLTLLIFVGEAVRDAFDPRKLPGGVGDDTRTRHPASRRPSGDRAASLLEVETSPSPSAAARGARRVLHVDRGETVALVGEMRQRQVASPRCPACACCRPPAPILQGRITLDGTDVLGADEARRCGACAAASPAWCSRSR